MSPGTSPAQPFKALRLVVVALMLGVATFVVVAVFLRPRVMSEESDIGFLLFLVSLGFLFLVFPLRLVAGRPLMKRLGERHEEATREVRSGCVPPELMSWIIITAALFEGSGLMGTIGYMLGAGWEALLTPAAALVFMGSFALPSAERLETLVKEARG
jgi:hypothetical protein